jgi:predicted MPP superfamily phosphohydrolase
MKMRKIPHKKILILILIIIILIPFCLYQNKHLVITTYTYESEKLGADLDGYRIVQISDLHNAEFGKENKKLLETIRSCSPDIIIITGDLVDSNHTNVERAVAFVKEAVKIAPVYYVTGNHEYWLDPSENEQMMQGILAAGAYDLDDEAVRIEKGDSSFLLVGLDDQHLSDETLKNLLQEQKNELSIVLAHEPQYLQNYANAEADLVLTGHAHGGQIRLPFVGGIVAPDQGFLPEYTSGQYNSADTEMIVSRGLGNSIIPVRLFNYPEVVCVELRCKN